MKREKASKKLRKTLLKANIIALAVAFPAGTLQNFWAGLTTFLAVFFSILGLIYFLDLKSLTLKEIRSKLEN